MPATISQNDRATMLGCNGVFAALPNDNPVFAPLVPFASIFVENFNTAEAAYQPAAFDDQRARIAGPLLSASHRAIVAATAEAKDTAAADARALEPPKAVAAAADRLGAEIRAAVPLNPGEQVAFVQQASAVQLAALLEANGSLARVHEQALEMARERARLVFHAERTALAASQPARPTIGRIVAVGADADAVQVQAQAAMARHRARLDRVEQNEDALQSLIGFLGAVLNVQPEQALDKVLAA